MDRCCLRSPNNVERDRLVHVAAKALHFEIALPGILRRPASAMAAPVLEAQHALVPSIDSEPVSLLAALPSLALPAGGASLRSFA
jgi:hypothetical protein